MINIGTFDLTEILTYLFLWTTLYFCLCIWNSSNSYEWNCRMVTVIHALCVSCLGFYCTFILGPWPFTDAGGPSGPFHVRIVSICLSYFLFDFSWCLYFKTEGPTMLVHHFLSIIGLSWCLFSSYYGTELVATIFGAEITNPLLQLRWFLRDMGCHRSVWADVVDWSFMLSFGFIRLGLGSMLLYSYYNQDTDFWGRLGGTCIYGIGVIFFISIVNYAIRKYARRYKNWVKRHSSAKEDTLTSNGGAKHINSDLKEDVGIIKEQEIPSQREIKDSLGELALRKNCKLQKGDES